MKIAVGLTLAALATSQPLSAAPGLDPSERSIQISTDEEVVLPENKPLERNEVVMDKRFDTETITRKEAPVGERRSDITVEEGREKKTFSTPERKKYDVVERKESSWAGKKSRFSTADDAYRSKVAIRFQDKIGEATPISKKVKPAVSQRTTFDKINRFAFRKNSDDPVSVTVAGSDKPAGDAAQSSSPGEALRAR